MIQVEGAAKSYGGRALFRDLAWRLADGERVGLVGPNGAGKTTLCRVLAGLEDLDQGQVTRPRDATIGYLPQEAAGAPVGSVLAEALSGFAAVWAIEHEMNEVAQALATAADDTLTARYGDLQHRFEALGGYRLESEARAILGGLGFSDADMLRPMAEFSGGWRMRAALARLLLLRPSLLLLDEPTNHLDLESLGWLEAFLTTYEGAVVVVSHDRYFLNRMVTSIADLGPTGLGVYAGDYDHFLVEREARRELLEARARNQAKQVAEVERFIERFRYQATKARQVQSRVKMLERLERVEGPERTREIRFRFPEPPRTGRRVIALRDVHKAYGAKIVYAGVNFEVERGDKVALVDSNGAGKSTLLRMVAGALPFEAGERILGSHVTVHYYAQHQLDALDPARTAIEELEGVAPDLTQTRLRTILGAFLFSGDAVEKKVAVLSGGEKARVALARMLVRPAALLALDEPTNHLDLVSREVLEEALVAFAGTIVFISHDRYFINRVATRIVEVEAGLLTPYPGGYDDYRAAKSAAAAAPVATAESRAATTPRAASPTPAPSRPRPAAELRELRRRREDVETRIHALEGRLHTLTAAFGDPQLYADGPRVRAMTQERRDAEEEVAGLMREWEALASRLAAYE